MKKDIPIRTARREFRAEALDKINSRRGFVSGGLIALAGFGLLLGNAVYSQSNQNNPNSQETLATQPQSQVQEIRSSINYPLEQKFSESLVSQRGIEFIKQFEGFSPVVYDPLPLDGIDEPTIGYGHLVKPGESFDEPISKREAESLLRKDIAIHEEPIEKYVTVPLNQNQYDALASFVYNIGETNFRKSTLLKKLNDGNYRGAANEFSKWKFSNGKALNGLENRRALEREMFLAE